MTRGEIAQTLYNLEGRPAVSGNTSFEDVSASAWYADSVNWAASMGVMNGYGNGNFGPEENITREQVATILYNYAQYKGYDMRTSSDLSGYQDASSISDWARSEMEWAVGNHLINGRTSSLLDPSGDATRAEVAKILWFFCEGIARVNS